MFKLETLRTVIYNLLDKLVVSRKLDLVSNIIKLQSLKRLIRFFISIHPPNNVLVQQVEKLSYDENYSVRSNAIKSFETELKYEPRHEKTNVLVSHTSNTNQALQLHKMARGLKFWIRKYRNCTIYVAKTKALISFAVTAKLICVFVFAYTKCLFSHDAAHI